MADTVAMTALSYALAAFGKRGGGGSGSGTVSVKIESTITGKPGQPASVVNLGTDQAVLLRFTIPQALPGSLWHISELTPGSTIEGVNENDLILYTTGDIYQVVKGIPVSKNINIIGQTGFSPIIEVKQNDEEGYILTITDSKGSFDTPNLREAVKINDGVIIDGGVIVGGEEI